MSATEHGDYYQFDPKLVEMVQQALSRFNEDEDRELVALSILTGYSLDEIRDLGGLPDDSL